MLDGETAYGIPIRTDTSGKLKDHVVNGLMMWSLQIAPFYDCYDATTRVRPYDIMPHWPACEVSKGDLVLIDIHVVKSKCNNTGRLLHKGDWSVCRVYLELRKVCMLRQSD